MAVLIRMPEVLANVTEAAIQSWLVGVGDAVAADAPLAEIETEKAMVEFASEHDGVVAELLVPAGETVAVGTPIAILRQEGDGVVDALRAIRSKCRLPMRRSISSSRCTPSSMCPMPRN